MKNTLYICLIFTLTGCERESVSQGRTIYAGTCTSCHNSNPKLTGSFGPDIAFSSRELIRLKTQEGKYPDGYKPKRSSNGMPRIPMSEKQIDALYKYLNEEQ